MSILDLLTELRKKDIQLSIDGDKLRIDAPDGVLTSDLIDTLKQKKSDLIAFLNESNLSHYSAEIAPIERVSRGQNLPLSWPQQRLWFLNQFQPDSPTYNIPSLIRLKGDLDVAAFERSLGKIVKRHETLRTTFKSVNGVPSQVVSTSVNVSIPVINLEDLAEEQIEEQVQSIVAKESRYLFDLQKGPLLRATLLRISAIDYYLIFVVHHIAFDGWSAGVLVREMGALYVAFTSGKPSPLSELPIQYVDYAQWQRQWTDGETSSNQLAYWKQNLTGHLQKLQLPHDFTPDTAQNYHGAKVKIEIPAQISREFRSLCYKEHTTLFMGLLAVFKVLLHRHSGMEDIIVGCPIANRNRTEIEGLIGCFLNSLALRTDLSGNPTFTEILKRVREVALGAFANQDIPFEKVLEEIKPDREINRTPVYQVQFVLQNMPMDAINLPNLTISPIDIDTGTTKFDLNLHALEREDGILAVMQYNADLYSAERINAMIEQYQALLERVTINPEERINDYSLLTLAQKKVLPDPTCRFTPESLSAVHERFSEQALHFPENTAIVDKWVSWSYGELERLSNQLANHLLLKGIQPGDVVAIYGHRSAGLVLSLLGILKAGGAFLILDPAYPPARLAKIMRAAQPSGLLFLDAAGEVGTELNEFIAGHGFKCQLKVPRSNNVMKDFLSDAPFNKPGVQVGPEDTAYLIFTSGTTGEPKGIVGTHRPLSHFVDWHISTFALKASDRFSMLSGLSHDPLLRDIFTPLCVGGVLCIPQSEEMMIPRRFRHWMREQGITVSHMTPAMSYVLTEGFSNESDDEETLPALHHVFFGGDVLTGREVARIRSIASKVDCVNFYGTTETPQAVGYHLLGGDKANYDSMRIPLGHGIEGVQLLILNSGSRLAGIGELGEIYVRTPYLSKGYLDDCDLTAAKYIQNPYTTDPKDRIYKTGDLGRYMPNGATTFCGRRDRQVSIRGFRIELGDIEACVKGMKAISDCVVVLREDQRGEKRLIAYYVLKQGYDGSANNLKGYAQSKLPEFMVPQFFVELATIPLTPNGKVDHASLPAPQERQSESISPRTQLEMQLVAIWENVLGVSGIGLRDNFFDLGGHSLLTLKLLNQMEKVFKKRFPLTTVFQAQTIEEMAAVIAEDSVEFVGSIVALQANGSRPPLFIIPGYGSSILAFGELARLLGDDQPVYCLQSLGLDGKQDPLDRIEDIASHFIDEIRNVQSKGPYHLAGLCWGGAVAFEIAQQLTSQDEHVAALLMIQTFTPDRPDGASQIYKVPAVIHQVVFAVQGILRHLRVFSNISPRQWVGNIKEKGRIIKEMVKSRDLYRGERSRLYQNLVENANLRAFRRYLPQPYRGRIIFIMPSNRDIKGRKDPKLFWGILAEKGLEYIEIPGYDSGFLLKKPYVDALADVLAKHLGHKGTC
jgi:amino acid adenylation domain-containing protein